MASNEWHTVIIDGDRIEELDDQSESSIVVDQTLFYIDKNRNIIRIRLDQPELIKEKIVTNVR